VHRRGALTRFFETGYKRIEGVYRHILAFSLNHRYLVLISSMALFGGSLYMTTFLGKEFNPPEDQGQFIVRLEAPIDYSLEKSDELFKPCEEILRSMPKCEQFITLSVRKLVNRASMMTMLVPKSERKKSQEMIKKEVRDRLRQLPGLKVSAEDMSMIGGGQRQVPIQYSVRGPNLNAIQGYTKQIAANSPRSPASWMWTPPWKWANLNSKSSSIATRRLTSGGRFDNRRGGQPPDQRRDRRDQV